MINQTIVSIYKLYSPHLPSGWSKLRIFYKFDEDSSMSFVDYINDNGEVIQPPLWLGELETLQLGNLMESLAPELNIGPGTVTHVELQIHNTGDFKWFLGYGPVDWYNMWPDDLTSETYTYNIKGPA